MRTLLVFVIGAGLWLGAAACGSNDKKGCPGRICSNCAAADCDITCPAGQIQVCESAANTGGDPNLRCTYCENL